MEITPGISSLFEHKVLKTQKVGFGDQLHALLPTALTTLGCCSMRRSFCSA